MFKVIGYRLIVKDGKNLVMIYCVRKSRVCTDKCAEKGLVCETHFLPPYLIDKVDSYVGKYCKLDFHKYNDKYTLSNVTVIDLDELSSLNVD